MTGRTDMIAEIENGMGTEGNTEIATKMLSLFEDRGWIDYSEDRGYFWAGEFGESLPESGFIEVWNLATGANANGSY